MSRRPSAAVVVLLAGLIAAAVPALAAAQATRPTARVAVLGQANLRAVPGTGKVLTKLKRGSSVTVTCQRIGPIAKAGTYTRVWDRVIAGARRGWVSDGLLNSGGGLVAGVCGVPLAAPAPAPAGVVEGPCAIAAPVALLPPFTSIAALILAAAPGAQASQAADRVPASVTLAQTILETGGGRSTAGANNYFGMKAQAGALAGQHQWGNHGVGCVLTKTYEAEGGRLVRIIDAFRAYAKLDDSILDHGERLATVSLYRPAFKYTDDPERFAKEIAKHYATDPSYASKVISLMRRYDLERFDQQKA